MPMPNDGSTEKRFSTLATQRRSLPIKSRSSSSMKTSDSSSHGTANVLWMQFIFLISGISQTVLVNLVSYHGGASPSTLLPVFTSYLAMAVVYFLPNNKSPSKASSNSLGSISEITPSHSSKNSNSNSPSKSRSRSPLNFSFGQIMQPKEFKIMCLALFDLMCGIISFLSLVWSGSAVFQLVYSSIIIVTATFRHFLLPNKKLTVQQWIACCIVTFGLLLSGFGNGANSKQHKNIDSSSLNVVFSAFSELLWPMITTILYAIEYVLIEMLLQGKNAPSDNELCFKMGFYGLIVVCCYIVINVIPRWNELFIHQIFAHNGSGKVIFLCYAFIFLSNFLHNWTYFMLLHASGAVSTGINQALRAVGVFVISGICFCELQEAQCFNSFKFLSLVVVIIGVLRYAFITAMAQRRNTKKLYMNMVAMDSDSKRYV